MRQVAALARNPFVRHLRLPFNLLLSPIYLWGAYLGGAALSDARLWIGFVAVHLFLYGGATAFNSAYDRDEGPVGGMLEPPPVPRGLLAFSLAVQLVGLPLAVWVGAPFAVAWASLGLVFVGYSHPRIRLKADPTAALLAIALGQGAIGFALGWLAAAPAAGLASLEAVLGMGSAALVVSGLYVITQIYQTEEDARRGDRTLPVLLGPPVALRWAAVGLALGGTVMLAELWRRTTPAELGVLLLFFAVVGGWILTWSRRFDVRDVRRNYRTAMRLALVSACGFGGAIVALMIAAGRG